MAQYVYLCTKCKKESVVERPMSEESNQSIFCPCGGTAARVYTSPSISFKGGGFYSTGG